MHLHPQHPLRRRNISLFISLLLFGFLACSPALLWAQLTGASEEDEVIEMEAVVVKPIEDEQGRSIRAKQEADAIGEFISADSLGQFIDTNIGDIVQRLPGVYTSGAGQSGGAGISVRGLRGDFNSLQVNGARLPSNQGQTRGVSIDTVPAELVGSVEVYKALTPDREADSIGGQVNIQTKTGLEFDERYFGGNLGYGTYDIGSSDQARISLNYADRITDKLGLFAAVSYRHVDERQRDEIDLDPGDYVWEQLVATDPAAEIDEDSDPTVFNFGRASVRRTLQSQANLGLTLNLDYQADDTLRYSFRSFYSQFDEDRPQWRLRYRFDRSDDDDPDGEEFGDSDFVYQEAPGLLHLGDDQRIRKRLGNQDETEVIQSYQLAFTKNLANAELSGDFTFSRAKRDLTTDEFLWETDDIPMTVDWRNPRRPSYRLTREGDPFWDDGFRRSDLFDPFFFDGSGDGFFPPDERRAQWIDAKDEIMAAKLDYKHYLDSSVGTTFIKAGVNLRMQDKVNDRDFVIVPSFNSDPDALTFETLKNLQGFGPIEFGIFPTESSLRALNPESTREVIDEGLLVVGRDADIAGSIGQDFSLSEDVFATYLMGSMSRDRWKLIGGARLESTSLEARGFAVDEPLGIVPDFINRQYDVRVSRDYEGVYPSLHLTYQANDNLLIRASLSTALARPSFQELFPATFASFVNEEIDDANDNGVQDPGEGREIDIRVRRGNADLDPTESISYDLSFEYYFKDTGLVSLAFFHKQLENWIFRGIQIADPSDFPEYVGTDPDLRNIVFDSYFNGSTADLSGAELNVSLPLGAGFSLQGNYTVIDMSVNETETGLDRVPGQAENLMNLALAYENRKLTARVNYYRSSEILDERLDLGDDAIPTFGSNFVGIYESKNDTWNLTVDYRATDRWTYWVSWEDFAGEAAISQLDNRLEFPEDIEYESWNILAGVKFKF